MLLESVRWAILLGSVSNSMSLLEEVRAQTFPDSYRQHLEYSLRRGERTGVERRSEAEEDACPDLAQAEASGTARSPSSMAEAERRETG